MNRLPGFFTTISPLKEVLAAMNTEHSALRAAATDKNAQLSVSTAESGLSLWEADYHLATEGTIADRCSRIWVCLRGRGPVTAALVEDIAKVLTGQTTAVTEEFGSYRLQIRFVDSFGEPTGLPRLSVVLRELLPAHLAWEYISHYRTYGALSSYTYGALSSYTHHELKEENLT